MNVEIGTEVAQFPFREYLFWIYGIVSLQCMLVTPSSRKNVWREQQSRDRSSLLYLFTVSSFRLYFCVSVCSTVQNYGFFLYCICFQSYTSQGSKNCGKIHLWICWVRNLGNSGIDPGFFSLYVNIFSWCTVLTRGLYISGPGKGSESVEQEGAPGGDKGQNAHQPRDQGERQELLNPPIAGLYAAAEHSDCWTLRSCWTLRLLDSTQLLNPPVAGL